MIHVYSRVIGCTSLKCRKIDESPLYKLYTRGIKPFGWPDEDAICLQEWFYHQVAVKNDTYVYDACIKMSYDCLPPIEGPWYFAVGQWTINGTYYGLLRYTGNWVLSAAFDYTQID